MGVILEDQVRSARTYPPVTSGKLHHSYVLAVWFLMTSLILTYGFYRGQPLLYMLIALIFLVAVFPLVRNGLLGRPNDIGEPILFIAFLYLLHFGVRAIYLDHIPGDAFGAYWGVAPSYSPDVAIATLSYVIVGITAMMFGYYSSVSKSIARMLPKSRKVFAPLGRIWPIYVILILGSVGQTVLFLSGYGTATTGKIVIPVYLNFLQTLASLLPIGIVLHLAMTVSSGKRLERAASAILVLLYIITSLLQGWRGFLLSLIWMVILPIHYLQKRVSLARFAIIGMICLLITMIILIPVLSYYRAQLVQPEASLTDSLRLAFRSNSSDFGDSLRFVFNRMLGFDSLMLLTESHERLWGQTLGYAILAFIPRALWPGKPNLDVGRLFAVRFWEQPVDVQNSISVMNIGDLLWNFDLLGVAIGMLLFGLLYRVIYDYLLTRPTTSSVFIYTILFTRLINIESGVGIFLTGIVITIFTLLLTVGIVRGLGRVRMRYSQGGQIYPGYKSISGG
ncbi:hypothetical protein SDD30_05925 [Moorella naiadis]|uniref:hypothetical protein n=1 Tax=Moorella naiadis (nom. illeg.) TaxID=3093670 RepID=UPI003D9C9799